MQPSGVESVGGNTGQEKEKAEKGTQCKLVVRSQWGDSDDANKSWRSIFVKEKENTKRKGFAVSHIVSQLDQQARHNQSGVAGAETRQAQGLEIMDRAVPEMRQGPPSRSLAEQSVNPEP